MEFIKNKIKFLAIKSFFFFMIYMYNFNNNIFSVH